MKKKSKPPITERVTESTTGKIQPILQPERRDKRTNIAIPSDKNVERAREFVIENKK